MKKISEPPAIIHPAMMKTPAVPQVKLNDLTQILTSLYREDGTALTTPDQAGYLMGLTFSTGEPILTLSDRSFVYEIVNMLYQLNYEDVKEFLDQDWIQKVGSQNTRRKILFESPLMIKSKLRQDLDMEIFRGELDVAQGMVNCKRCGSENTIAMKSQTRSGDEGMTIKVTCIQCGYKWTAQ